MIIVLILKKDGVIMFPDDKKSLNYILDNNSMLFNGNAHSSSLSFEDYMRRERDVSNMLKLSELTSGYIEGDKIKESNIRIYTENIESPLYNYFLDDIDTLPVINSFTYKRAAKKFYNEYKEYNVNDDRRIFININSEWKGLTLDQFKNSLEKVLLTSYKEENIKKLIKEINNLIVKDNLS
ncbi:hypothetical protein [Staphylococcus phage vB_StaM_SA1]|nr:hypothetical protein [Staphylococcus phage vB_StaM_SA1]